MSGARELVQKKLKQDWSFGLLTQALVKDSNMIEEICMSYEQFDKKILKRVFLSLLGSEPSQRSSCIPSIKKLLIKAAGDKDEWVSVIAGITHHKLFGIEDPDIERKSFQVLTKTADDTIEKLQENLNISTRDSTFYFQPNEYKFFHPDLIEPFSSSSSNHHFAFVGGAKTFLEKKDTLQPSSSSGSSSKMDQFSVSSSSNTNQLLLKPNSRPSLFDNSNKAKVSSSKLTLGGGGMTASKGLLGVSCAPTHHSTNKVSIEKIRELQASGTSSHSIPIFITLWC